MFFWYINICWAPREVLKPFLAQVSAKQMLMHRKSYLTPIIAMITSLTFGNEKALKGDPTVEPMNDFAGVVSVDGTALKLSTSPSSPSGNLIGVNPDDWLKGSCRRYAGESLDTENFHTSMCRYSLILLEQNFTKLLTHFHIKLLSWKE